MFEVVERKEGNGLFLFKLENTGDVSVTEHLRSVGRFCLEDLILLWDFSLHCQNGS